MKAKDLLPLWLLAAVFSAVLMLGCSKSKPEEPVPYWVEEGEPAQNSKEELAKWHQESIDLLKALAALEVTSKGTGKKRKVFIQTASTLEKAEAMAFGLSPENNRKQQGEKPKDKGSISSGNGPSLDDFLEPGGMGALRGRAAVIETNKGLIKIIAGGEGGYLAEAILQSSGNLVSFVQSEEITGKQSFPAKANANISGKGEGSIPVPPSKINQTRSDIKSMGKGRIGPFKFSFASGMETMTKKIPEFNSRIESSDEYKVEGKTGSLIARSVLKVEEFDKVSLARVNRSLQENGLSMVDFVGGLLEEGNNIYTLIICADKKGEEFGVYLIFNKENFDKEKAGSDE